MPAAARPSRFVARAPLLAVLVLACGSTNPSAAPASAGVPSATPSSTAAPSEAPPSEAPPSGATGSPATGTGVAVEPIVEGLEGAIWVGGAGDGSGRLFVAEQAGRIRVLKDGALLDAPFLDITDRVTAGGERGLLGVAFPPGYGPDRPFVYVHYSGDEGATVLSEFRLTADPDRADPASERVVLTEPQPYANHNGGWAGFDPSGMLLLALGDGGSGGDPENRASDLGSLLGKILRIDPTRPGDGREYGIPADNPFVDREGARPEILHYGLRNPFRDAFDPVTGDLWIGDVGQNAWEEVDVARAGASGLDFGWRRWEGNHCFNPSTDCDPEGVTQPVAEYGHSLGCSVIGGVVYRGEAIPDLRGAYLFSDYCSGTLWTINAGSDEMQEPRVLLETGANISAIATAEDGEVVMTDLGGRVLRLVPAG